MHYATYAHPPLGGATPPSTRTWLLEACTARRTVAMHAPLPICSQLVRPTHGRLISIALWRRSAQRLVDVYITSESPYVTLIVNVTFLMFAAHHIDSTVDRLLDTAAYPWPSAGMHLQRGDT